MNSWDFGGIIREARSAKYIILLVIFNLIFSSCYLFSASDRMPGFPYRQDAYGYMLEATYLIRLSRENSAEIVVSWFDLIYCGFKHVFTDLPLQLIYLPLYVLTDDFILAYKLTLFALYVLATLAMYYLTYVITKDHAHSFISATVYVFSQVLAFEVFMGHLSMIFGYALIPLIVATCFKTLWNRSLLHATLSGVIYSVLLIIRPDFGYFTCIFLVLFVFYFIFAHQNRQNLYTIGYALILFSVAFSFSFPFLYQRYVSSAGLIASRFERSEYDYSFYTPKLEQYLLPYSVDTNAYLGISVISLLIIGFYSFYNNNSIDKIIQGHFLEFRKLSVFLLIVLLIFLFFSLGGNVEPMYAFLHRYLPYFNVLRVPTRWLVYAQLCLAILSGNGALFLMNRIPEKLQGILSLRGHTQTVIIILLAGIILLDYSTYFGRGKRFHFTTNAKSSEWQDYFFIFPPALEVPLESDVFGRISASTITSEEGPYRILIFPNVYTVTYFYYVENLRESNVTFAYGYGYYPRLGLQEETYQDLVGLFGKEPADSVDCLGEKLRLLDVKYVVFQPDRLDAARPNSWVLVANNTAISGADENVTITLEKERTGRWLNLTGFLTEESTGHIQGYEFWAYDTISSSWKSPDSIYHNCTGTDSSEFIDGNIDSYWSCNETHYHEIVVEYNNPINISQVRIFVANASEANWTNVDIYLGYWNMSEAVAGAGLKYVTSDYSFDLYENEHFKGNQSQVFAVNNLNETMSVKYLLSKENQANASITYQENGPMIRKLEVSTNSSCFIILSQSYDDDWQAFCQNKKLELKVEEYNGISYIFLDKPGDYVLSVEFAGNWSALSFCSFYGALIVVVVTLNLLLATRRRFH